MRRAAQWFVRLLAAWWRANELRRRALPASIDLGRLARDLAARLPIAEHAVSPTGEIVLSGQAPTHRFRLTYSLANALTAKPAETLVEVHPVEPALPLDFSLLPRMASSSDRDFGERVPTGDRLFDQRWIVEGDANSVPVAMTADCRQLISRSGQLSVSNGWLYMVVDGLNADVEGAEAQVAFATNLALELARGLAPGSSAERIAANLRSETNGYVKLHLSQILIESFDDPVAAKAVLDCWLGAFKKERRATVRRRVLELLAKHLPEQDGTLVLLREGLLDPLPDVRLFAARLVGAEGLPIMKQVAGTRFASAESRIDALFLLGQRLPPDEFRELLILCAKEAAPRVRRYALRRLLDELVPSLADDLVRIAKASDRDAAVELAEILAESAGEIAEPALLQLLSSRSTHVKCAAARSLGVMGSVEAVPRLLQLAGPIVLDGGLRDIARSAILQIQYRIEGGELGGLSLVAGEDQTGGLSAPECDVGALSFRPREVPKLAQASVDPERHEHSTLDDA